MKTGYLTLAARSDGVVLPGGLRHRAPGDTLPGYLLRTYLDLGGARDEGPWHARGTRRAVEEFAAGRDLGATHQMHGPPGLRAMLAVESGLPNHDVTRPGDLAPELRTSLWEQIVDGLAGFADLEPAQQVRLASAVSRLGFYREVVRACLPAVTQPGARRRPQDAQLRLLAANALHKLRIRPERYLPLIASAAVDAQATPGTRLAAATTLVVLHAKGPRPSMAEIEQWRRLAEEAHRAAVDGIAGVQAAVAHSIFWRAVCFIPFLAGDREETQRQLDRAWEAISDLSPSWWWETCVLAENLHPLLETSARVAEWAGDGDRALELSAALVDHDPFDPKVHLQHGKRLERGGDLESVVVHYRRATQLGPPFTSYAYLALGRALASAGDLDAALEAHTRAVECNTAGITAVEELRRLAEQCKRRDLCDWAEHLSRRQQERGGNSPRP